MLIVRRTIAVVSIQICPGMVVSIALQLLMLTVSRFIAVDASSVLTIRRTIAVVPIAFVLA